MIPKRQKNPLSPLIFILCAFFFATNTVYARDYSSFGPITVRNQNPAYLQTLSLTPTRATVLPSGTIEVRIDSAYSNLYEVDSSSKAFLSMDMELWRLAPQISYGIADDFELGVEIPLLHFSGGFLDGFIQRFHKFFGFPNGGRERVANGLFSYRLTADGATRFDYSSVDMGLGDITLHLKHQLMGEEDNLPAIALFADLKFPTGQKSRGLGNGSLDFGVGTAVEASWKRLHGYLNLGYFVTGGNLDYVDYMRNEMFAYTVAGELTILPTWSFIVQLNGSTPLLSNTNMNTWDGVPMDLIVGFRGEQQKLLGSQDFIWQFGFSEDVTSKGPSVDFTVFVSLGIRLDMFGRSKPAGDWLAVH